MTPPRPPLNSGPDQPEREAVRHPGVDGVEQPAPRRSGTLTGMPAAPRLDVPPLPVELQPTRRAPAPWAQTVMRPTPPSTKALARRSDPPPSPGPPPPSGAPGGQPDALAELQRQLAEAQAQIDRLRRPAFPPPVSEHPRLPAPPVPPATGSVPPTGWSDPRLIKAVTALALALAGLGTPLGIWLMAKAAAAERAAERQSKVANDATATASSAKAQSRDVAKEVDDLRARLAARDAYHRAILRRLGVEYPSREGEPAEPVLTTQTPQRKPGQVGPQPVLVVTGPAPP